MAKRNINGSPNLLSRDSREESEEGESRLKILALIFSTALLAGVSSWLLGQIFAAFSLGLLVWFTVLGSLFLISFFLSSLFIQSTAFLALLSFAASSGLSWPFFSHNFFIQTLICFILGIFFFLASLSLRKEKNLFVRISFIRFAKTFLPRLLSAFLVFIILSLYFSFSQSVQTGSRDVFNKAVLPLEKGLNSLAPVLDAGMSFRDFISGILKQQLPEGSDIEIKAMANELARSLGDFFGMKVDPTDKLSYIVYQLTVNSLTLNLKDSPFAFVILGMLALSVLGTIRLTAVPLGWLLTFPAYGLYLLLLALDFAVIQLEGRSQEILTLK